MDGGERSGEFLPVSTDMVPCFCLCFLELGIYFGQRHAREYSCSFSPNRVSSETNT